ncbi:SRPBCC family protein [Mycolicibacterium sp. S2-37]|uniref:SRPBCC family protein n=1 Tax=Mycolicibacterium sp. S2-37 TaxID=2810297 RepID=UPI001A941A6E|nr:SRPBCC family protein [Mycolicibacterium sp. S2-37]MBO0678886.1 SRPBCC family protein [Mycolicibacterium sp. S2-37]
MTNSNVPALLITPLDRTVPITVQQRTRLAPGESMDLTCPIDLTRVFHRVAPFPAVVRVDDQIEAWDHEGPSRRPRFSDGSSADEQLIEYVSGSSFAYQLTGFTNALSKFVAGIRGEWTFTPDGQGALVRWSYEFKPRPGRRWIIAGPFKPLWRRYMTAALARCIEASEADAAVSRATSR